MFEAIHLIAGIQTELESWWNSVVDYLIHQDNDKYRAIREIALFLTMIVSILLCIVMYLFTPQHRLDKALFIRELALASILLLIFKSTYFGRIDALWNPLAWSFLAIASLFVLIELIREHFLILKGDE